MLSNYIFHNNKEIKNIKFSITAVFLFISGLPPTPLFFVKLWLLSELTGSVWALSLIFMMCTNTALLFAYYNYFTKTAINLEETEDRVYVDKYIPWAYTSASAVILIAVPHLFCIF